MLLLGSAVLLLRIRFDILPHTVISAASICFVLLPPPPERGGIAADNGNNQICCCCLPRPSRAPRRVDVPGRKHEEPGDEREHNGGDDLVAVAAAATEEVAESSEAAEDMVRERQCFSQGLPRQQAPNKLNATPVGGRQAGGCWGGVAAREKRGALRSFRAAEVEDTASRAARAPVLAEAGGGAAGTCPPAESGRAPGGGGQQRSEDPSEAAQGTASAGAGLTRRSHRSRRTEHEEGEARVDEQDDVGHDELGGLRRAPPAPEARRRNGSPFIIRTGEGDRFPPPQQQQLPLLLSEQAVRCDARQSAGTSVVGGSRTHARQSARTFAMNR